MVDPGKIRIAAGTVRVEIDEPENCRIQKPKGRIRGWFAAGKLVDIPETFSFRAGNLALPHRVVRRLDVEGAMPDYVVTGFEIPYDLSTLLARIHDNRLLIHLTLADYDSYPLKFRVDDSALVQCVSAASDG